MHVQHTLYLRELAPNWMAEPSLRAFGWFARSQRPSTLVPCAAQRGKLTLLLGCSAAAACLTAV